MWEETKAKWHWAENRSISLGGEIMFLEAGKALDKGLQGWMEHSRRWHHQRQKPKGGKAEMNSMKPAHREEVGNRTGAVCWGHVEGPWGPGRDSVLNLWDSISLLLIWKVQGQLHFRKFHVPTMFGMDGRAEGYRQGGQLGSPSKCVGKREQGRWRGGADWQRNPRCHSHGLDADGKWEVKKDKPNFPAGVPKVWLLK